MFENKYVLVFISFGLSLVILSLIVIGLDDRVKNLTQEVVLLNKKILQQECTIDDNALLKIL